MSDISSISGTRFPHLRPFPRLPFISALPVIPGYAEVSTTSQRKTDVEIGLNYAFGTSSLHDAAYLKDLVQTVEELGFGSLWMPEHVVSFPSDHYQSKYPYSDDGSVPWRGDLSLHDPLMVTIAAAQHTSTLRFGSGIVILPQRPPLLTAKELMTLDHLTGGRFEFGVGGGWSSEEYQALGVPFDNRGKRFDEYIEAIRTAWRDQPASYQGRFVEFSDVVLAPKPLTPGGPKMLIGRRSSKLIDTTMPPFESKSVWSTPGHRKRSRAA
jgi:probable F420-dependent oxidoreductase